MVHLKASIFISSLVFLQVANGWPTRFANIQEKDTKTDVALVRLKRVSDQRLAELETLYALSKINLVTSTDRPISMRINPAAIGRRKRSSNNSFVHKKGGIDRLSNESTINEILIS